MEEQFEFDFNEVLNQFQNRKRLTGKNNEKIVYFNIHINKN